MVIPVRDVNPVLRTPWVTYVLIAANIVVFLLTPAAGITTADPARQACQGQAFLDHYAAIPEELTHNQPKREVADSHAVADSRGQCPATRPDYHKIPAVSALTSLFLHGSWWHLLGNMLFLWIFGNNIEDRFGRLRYLLFYLACGVVATYGFALANPDSPEALIGASGAIAGVLGAYLVLYPRARVWSLVPVLFFIPLRLPAWLVLGLWFLLQWAYTSGYVISEGSVAYLAHVLGFLLGVLVALVIRGSAGGRRAIAPHPY
ncbi:MAG TPA: rhomboid family intramembrane serine protease [Pseudonocardiaceae bacterium]|nr:rhomboid family intramembrane serine protease [Pseudonocardiaceae bacterium]